MTKLVSVMTYNPFCPISALQVLLCFVLGLELLSQGYVPDVFVRSKDKKLWTKKILYKFVDEREYLLAGCCAEQGFMFGKTRVKVLFQRLRTNQNSNLFSQWSQRSVKFIPKLNYCTFKKSSKSEQNVKLLLEKYSIRSVGSAKVVTARLVKGEVIIWGFNPKTSENSLSTYNSLGVFHKDRVFKWQ